LAFPIFWTIEGREEVIRRTVIPPEHIKEYAAYRESVKDDSNMNRERAKLVADRERDEWLKN